MKRKSSIIEEKVYFNFWCISLFWAFENPYLQKSPWIAISMNTNQKWKLVHQKVLV